jgi:DNA-binding transcriptional LysR family regulator
VALQLTVSPRGSAGLIEGLLDGSLDLAVASVPGRAPAGVRVRQVYRERLELVLPAGHRLADATEVDVVELAGEEFVDFPPGYGNRIVVDRAFAAAGIRRHVAIEVTDIASGADYVRQGLGVAVLPPYAVRDRHGLIVKSVTGPDLDWPLGLAIPAARAQSAAARALVALIEERLAEDALG